MPITDTSFYRNRDDILAEMLAALIAAIPDAYVGEDGNWYISFQVQAGQLENLFLAHQLLLEDMFITTASYTALLRHGEQYAVPPKDGTPATGTLLFTGTGGTYIPIGAEVAYDPGGGLDPVYFQTTLDGTIPDTNVATPPTAAINATAGNLNGLYEYSVTYVTTAGETIPSAISTGVSPVNQQVNLTAIPVGGTGVTARRIYRRKNGTGDFRRVTEIANNTATTYTDNITDAAVAGSALAPTVDTAHRLSLPASASEPGSDGNCAIGAVNILSNAPSTLSSVVNTTAFAGGSEPEDTEDYRTRLLAWIQNPQTGSPNDLKAIAENVAGVESATVFPNQDAAGTATPGTTTVRISGPGGTVPDSTVQANVLAALQAFDVANMTIVVATFTPVATNVTVDVTTSGTYSLADVTPNVQLAVTNYINSLDVGETLKISGIIDAVFGLPGVDDVTVTTPSSNQTTAASSKRTPGTITVT